MPHSGGDKIGKKKKEINEDGSSIGWFHGFLRELAWKFECESEINLVNVYIALDSYCQTNYTASLTHLLNLDVIIIYMLYK